MRYLVFASLAAFAVAGHHHVHHDEVLLPYLVNPGGIGGIYKGPDSATIIKGPDGAVIRSKQIGGAVAIDAAPPAVVLPLAKPVVPAGLIQAAPIGLGGYRGHADVLDTVGPVLAAPAAAGAIHAGPVSAGSIHVAPSKPGVIHTSVTPGRVVVPAAGPVHALPAVIPALPSLVHASPVLLAKEPIIVPEVAAIHDPKIVEEKVLVGHKLISVPKKVEEDTDLVGPSGTISTRGGDAVISGPASITVKGDGVVTDVAKQPDVQLKTIEVKPIVAPVVAKVATPLVAPVVPAVVSPVAPAIHPIVEGAGTIITQAAPVLDLGLGAGHLGPAPLVVNPLPLPLAGLDLPHYAPAHIKHSHLY